MNLCHCQHDADDLSFVGVPIGGGDSAFLCELGACGDELGVVSEDVDLFLCHGRVVCLFVDSNIQQNVKYTIPNNKIFHIERNR